MKSDPGSNYTIATVETAESKAAAAHNSDSVDCSKAQSVAFLIDVGTVGSSATIDCKVQHSVDDSTWVDEVAGAGNDTAITQITSAGSAQLNVPNPRARYVRVVTTVGTAASIACVVAVSGPLLNIAPDATT